MLKERLLQIVSVTVEVAISRRASRFKFQLQDHQEEAKRDRGGWGARTRFSLPYSHCIIVLFGGVADLHPWRGDGAWIRPGRFELTSVGERVIAEGRTKGKTSG